MANLLTEILECPRIVSTDVDVSWCKVITPLRFTAQHDILATGGNSAGSPEPILRPSPTTDHDAEILSAEDPYLSYDAEKFPYQ